MKRYFIKLAEYPFDDIIRKRIEKEKERQRRDELAFSRLKTPTQRRNFLRYRSEGGFSKDELDYKYED